MKNLLILIVSILTISACSNSKKIKHTIWEMKNGIALIEVESVVEGREQPGIWESYTEHPGFSGKTAYRMASSGNEYMDPLAHDAEKTNEPYKLTYRVYVSEAGEYEVRIHNFHWQKDGDNDAWIGINDDLYEKIWDHDTLVWSWNEAIAWQFSYQPRWLHKGVNTISIVGRSENWVIDRIAVVKQGTPEEAWQNISLPESEKLVKSEKPLKPANLSVNKTGASHTIVSWKETENAVAYQIFLNDEYLRTTYKTNASIGNLNADNENIIKIIAENSLGEVSKPSKLTVQPSLKNTKSIKKYSSSFSSLPWESISNLSQANDINLKLAAIDSLLALQIEIDAQNGFLNVSIDPDNSKSETFSMNDRLYYTKIENPEIRERLNRSNYAQNVILENELRQGGRIKFTIGIPYSTLGKKLNFNDVFGMKVWISEGGKGEGLKTLILGDEDLSEILFPKSFADLIIENR